MKLLKKFVNALSLSRASMSDSFEKLNSPTKRRKTIDNSDDIPHQLIELPIGEHIIHLNEQQYMMVRSRASDQLEIILKKCLRMSKKDASKLVFNLQNHDQFIINQPQDTLNIFNCPLIQLPADIVNPDTQLPRVIVKLMHSFVSRGGFEQEGPFRVEGDKQQLSELVAGISSGYESNGTSATEDVEAVHPVPGSTVAENVKEVGSITTPTGKVTYILSSLTCPILVK